MYAGKLVELGTTDEVFHEPHMPYTIGLLRSVPNMLTAGTQRLVPLEGLTAVAERPAPRLPLRAALPRIDRRVPRHRARADRPRPGFGSAARFGVHPCR